MLDIKFIRENSALVKKNMKKRYKDSSLVDEFLVKDEKYRKLLYKTEQLKHQRNIVSAEIRVLKKDGKSAKVKILEAKTIPEEIAKNDHKIKKLKIEMLKILYNIPNMIDESVPIGKNDTENKEIEKVGKIEKKYFDVKGHVELSEKLGIVDFEISAKVSGKGFYYLIGDLALLNRALVNYAIDFMQEKGFTYVETPWMIKGDVLNSVFSHQEIEELVYKIDGEDLYPIATSEHSLIGMFGGKVIDEEKLPLLLCSFSPCFRKEIGSHGIDEKGLFRTHQFNKVEMVVLCKPKDSKKYYDKMLKIGKDFMKKLEFPFRVLECCSGDLALLKTKSCDLEYWSPRKKGYSEISSLSNMGDAQARRLGIKATDGKEKYFVHTLNNTVVAASRAMVAILENNQTKDGKIIIPKVLRPYMYGKKVIE